MSCFKKIAVLSAFVSSALTLQVSAVSAEETTDAAMTASAAVTAPATVSVTTWESSESTMVSSAADAASAEGSPAETADTAGNINKYYSDSKYDTDGNATLIKEETVIYKSEEMQFIAVTTKDGSVFYVLINYSAAGDENNVYFLNKVDDYDLYALLYAGDNTKVYDARAASDAAERANENEQAAAETTDAAEYSEEQTESSDTAPALGIGTLIPVIAVLAAGGAGAFIYIKSGRKNKKSETLDFDDDTDLEFDEED